MHNKIEILKIHLWCFGDYEYQPLLGTWCCNSKRFLHFDNINLNLNYMWFDNLCKRLEELDVSNCCLYYNDLVNILSANWKSLRSLNLSGNTNFCLKCYAAGNINLETDNIDAYSCNHNCCSSAKSQDNNCCNLEYN